MVVIATGFKPNDDLARKAGLEVGERGGIKVDLFCVLVTPVFMLLVTV